MNIRQLFGRDVEDPTKKAENRLISALSDLKSIYGAQMTVVMDDEVVAVKIDDLPVDDTDPEVQLILRRMNNVLPFGSPIPLSGSFGLVTYITGKHEGKLDLSYLRRHVLRLSTRKKSS